MVHIPHTKILPIQKEHKKTLRNYLWVLAREEWQLVRFYDTSQN